MDITSLSKALIAAIRDAGPIATVAAIAAILASLLTAPGRARVRLSLTGLAGVTRGSGWRRAASAVLVPGLAVSVLSVSLALEQEIRTGPNRVIDQLAAPARTAGGIAWVFERGTSHFMDDSRIPGAGAVITDPEPGRWPFWSQLAIVRYGSDDQAGLLFATPATADTASPLAPVVDTASARCTLRNGRCALEPGQAVTDADLAPIGAHLVIRGRTLTVVAHSRRPVSLLNRAVVFVPLDLFTQPGGIQTEPYGLVVAGPDAMGRAKRLAASMPDTEVLTQQQLLNANSRFWAGNGTPLVLLIIALSALFAGTAMYASRRAIQEQARVSIGTLRALGLTPGRAALVDLCRAFLVALAAGVIAAPIAIGLTAAANAAILGFHASVTPLMVLAAIGVVVVSDVLGTVVLWRYLRRASIVEAISGI